jgi:terminase, large subunit
VTTLAHHHTHPKTRAAIAAAVRLGLESLRAEPPMRLSDWAEKHFKMAGESSHQKGDWEAWPFQVGIMDFMSDDRIEELAVMKSKRVGYTKMITADIAYTIAHLRRNQAIWQPTDDDRDSYVKSEIDPVLDRIAAVDKAKKTPSNSSSTATAPCTCWVARLPGHTAASPWRVPGLTSGMPSTRRWRKAVILPASPRAGWRGRHIRSSSVEPPRASKA